jgi:lipopolysaccharide/colanic/teichoic acid biosynthesis glycosyltransferase
VEAAVHVSVASLLAAFVPVSQRVLLRDRLALEPATPAVADWAGQLPILSERLFRGALVRERNRADRFADPFLLVTVNMNGEGISWRACYQALAAVKRDSDILGWLEEGSSLALILPDLTDTNTTIPSRVEQRVRRELGARCNIKSAAQASVQSYLYSGPASVAANPDAADRVCSRLLSAPECKRVRDVCKRVLDVAGSAALLALLSPVLLLIATAIRITSAGPVLFRQKRIGLMGRPFDMLKFRSMYVNVDQKAHQEYVSWFIKSSGQAERDQNTVFKLTADKRITAVGHIIRNTSLDELPQLWNVLRGDMSLVGPRPPLKYEVDEYQPWHWRRVMDAKPGITGEWQVNGRSRTTFDEMVRLDLRYARKHSLWTDIRILLATPRAVISGKGAC